MNGLEKVTGNFDARPKNVIANKAKTAGYIKNAPQFDPAKLEKVFKKSKVDSFTKGVIKDGLPQANIQKVLTKKTGVAKQVIGKLANLALKLLRK